MVSLCYKQKDEHTGKTTNLVSTSSGAAVEHPGLVIGSPTPKAYSKVLHTDQ